MKYLSTLAAITLFLLISFISGCDDTITSDDIDKRDIPETNVSFSKNLLPVFNLKCSSGQCHNTSYMAGGYSMETWTNVVQAGIVNPGSPQTSRLVWSIDAQYGFELMPPVGSPINPMTKEQIDGVFTWIAEGAKNN